jgi:hypothetical protein
LDLSTAGVHLFRDLVTGTERLPHGQRRQVLVDVLAAVEELQRVLGHLATGGQHAHLDAAVRGLRMVETGVGDAVDALGPVPGGNPGPVMADRRRRRREQPDQQ